MMTLFLVHWMPRFHLARDRMSEIAEWRALPSKDIQARQLACINKVWARARQSSPYYRRCADAGALPEAFSSLEEFSRLIPVLERETLRHSAQELMCRKKEPGFWTQTGGSTGMPTPVYKDRSAHGWALATQYFHRKRLGADIFSPIGMLWGHSVSFAPGFKGWLKKIAQPIEDRLRNRQRMSVYDLSPGALDRHLAHLRRFKPVLLYGYATALYLMAEAAEQTRSRWPELKAIVSSSEVLPDALRDRIGSAFGVIPCEEYGAMECGILATSLPGQPMEVEEHNVFLETIPNGTGSYDILATPLWNRSMPLLRYRLGDCCERPIEPATTGYRHLGPVVGRANDNLVGGDGRLVHSEAVSHILKYYVPSIRRFTALQDDEGAVTVHVERVAGQDVPVSDLRRRFAELLQRPIAIAVCDHLPAGAGAGKHRWVVSRFRSKPPAPGSTHDRPATS
jgi:phenylacetate-CoA ligase